MTPAERERKRCERIVGQAPAAAGVLAAFVVTPLAIYFLWWPRWWLLALAAPQAFFLAMETITWWDARRRLASGDFERRPLGRKPPEHELDDPELGKLAWRSEEEHWCLEVMLQAEPLVVRLDGERTEGPTIAARTLWLEVRPRLEALWTEVARYAVAWSAREGIGPIEVGELAPSAVDVCPDDSLEGGNVVFYFYVASDPDGSYFVPIRDDKPLLVHRDS